MKTTTNSTTVNLTDFSSKTVPNVPCVYTVKNTITHRMYIGSSKALYRRFSYTLSCLRRGVSLPKDMLDDYKVYGPECFELTFTEVEIEQLFYTEKLLVALNIENSPYNIYYNGKSKRTSSRDSQAWNERETIRRLRYEQGLTLKNIAAQIQTSYSTVWRILQTL